MNSLSFCADTLSLPSSLPNTPQEHVILNLIHGKGPFKPYSQGELSPVRRHGLQIAIEIGVLVLYCLPKSPFNIPFPP